MTRAHTRSIVVALGVLALSGCMRRAQEPGRASETEGAEAAARPARAAHPRAQAQPTRAQRQAQRADRARRLHVQEQQINALFAQREVEHREQQLRAEMQSACSGVPDEQRQVCPLTAAEVASVSEIDNGVELRLTARAEAEEAIERQIACYRATRAHASHVSAVAEDASDASPDIDRPNIEDPGDTEDEVATTEPIAAANQPLEYEGAATTCLFDDPKLDIDVEDQRDRVVIEVTIDQPEEVADLREEASTWRTSRRGNRASAER